MTASMYFGPVRFGALRAPNAPMALGARSESALLAQHMEVTPWI